MSTNSKQSRGFEPLLTKSGSFLLQAFEEIAYGIRSKSIDWTWCLTPGLILNVANLLRVDSWFFRRLGIGFLPPSGTWTFLIYSALLASAGVLAWGVWQSILFLQVSRKLTEVFQTSGLKNAIGKLPSFVFDRPVDEFTRRMRLTKANLPVSSFVQAKEALESALNVYVDEIKESRERGTVDIVYATLPIPQTVKLKSFEEVGKREFIIGETRARQIKFDFDETPHLLVGGQSGGGKSTFLRQMIATLYINNKSFRFFLIDLKGGLEFQIFEDLERVTVVPKASTALDHLRRLEEHLKLRMEVLKAAQVKDITAYESLPTEKRKESESKVGLIGGISRTIIVIDEAAELFLASDKSRAQSVQQAKSCAIKIAAQGRAVGIHLIAATQRPDVRAVDGQIKANLSGALAFQMPNLASSMTILDNARASHLPKVPGRAIWKTGLEMVELQTPFVSVDEVNKALEPYRKEKEAANA